MNKNSLSRSFFAFLFLCAGLFIFSSVHAQTLYDDLSRRGTIKIFVEDPVDATTKRPEIPGGLKKALEAGLAGRKSVKFLIVPTAAEADMMVKTEIRGFLWSDHDPVDMIMGTGPVAWDAVNVENYARLEADMQVVEKSGRVLWKDRLSGSVTQKEMPEKISVPLAEADFTKTFLREFAGKKRR